MVHGWPGFLQHPGPNEEGLLFLTDLANKFSPVFRIHYGPMLPIVSCTHPSSMRTAIKGTEAKPRGFLGPYEFLAPWLGKMDVIYILDFTVSGFQFQKNIDSICELMLLSKNFWNDCLCHGEYYHRGKPVQLLKVKRTKNKGRHNI